MRSGSRLKALARVADALDRRGARIVTVNMSLGAAHESGGMLLVVSLEGEESAGSVASELRRLEGVDDVSFVEPQVRDALIDTYHFPVMDALGRTYVLMDTSFVKALVVGIRKAFGAAGAAFLYHQGKLAGQLAAEALRRRGYEGLEEALNAFLLEQQALGRFVARASVLSSFEDAEPRWIVVRVWGSWECEACKGEDVPCPAGAVTRGMLAGLVERYTGAVPDVRETRCVACGDGYCEFEVRVSEERYRRRGG